MSFNANTLAGVLRRVSDGILLKCPGCGQWLRLSDDQFHGRVSVDHASMGCKGGYHKKLDYAAALALVGWSRD